MLSEFLSSETFAYLSVLATRCSADEQHCFMLSYKHQRACPPPLRAWGVL